MRFNQTALYEDRLRAAEGLPAPSVMSDPTTYRTMPANDSALNLFEIQGDDLVFTGGMPRVYLEGAFHDPEGDQGLYITEPAMDRAETSTIVHFPGCTENPEVSTAKLLHANLAALNPSSRVISIANDGIGRYSHDMSLGAALSLGFDDMASARLRVIKDFTGDQPVRLATESMGGVIGMHLLQQNMLTEDDRPVLDIESVVMHSGSRVTPDQAPKVMNLKFLPHMAKDMVRQTRRHPGEVLDCAQPRFDLLHRSAVNAVVGQIVHMEQGVDYSLMDSVAGTSRVGFISGRDDPLRQEQILRQLQTDHPETVRVRYIEDGGHALNLSHHQTAQDIQAMFAELDALPHN